MPTTTIDIHDRYAADEDHLQAALRVVLRHHHVMQADIFVQPREASGWLEYICRIKYDTGGGMTIGVIQRAPGEPVEAHS